MQLGKLIERGIPTRLVELGQLVSLLCLAPLGFQLPAKLLHLLLRQCRHCLFLLNPRFLVAQLVPLLKKCLLPGLEGLLVRLKLLGNGDVAIPRLNRF